MNKMAKKNRYDELEIYLDDLTPKAQKEVLEFLGLKSAEEGNLDVLPVAVIPKAEVA